MTNHARQQVETALASAEFRARVLETARVDVGSEDAAAELAAQLSLEVLRASSKYEFLNNPEAFIWACYKRCKRDAVRKAERLVARGRK